MSLLKQAVRDEDGAVTIDWVVLTAAVVIMTIGAIAVLDSAIADLLTATGNYMTFSNIAAYF